MSEIIPFAATEQQVDPIDILRSMSSAERSMARAIRGTKRVPYFATNREPLTGKASRRGVPGAFGNGKVNRMAVLKRLANIKRKEEAI